MRTFSQVILEMSFDAKRAMIKIGGIADPLNRHLMKLWMYPDAKDIPHWKDEIDTWVDTIANMEIKPNQKKLSKETYFRILYEEPLDDISDYAKSYFVKSITKRYVTYPTSFRPEDFDSMREGMRLFYDELCALISTNRYDGNLGTLLDKFTGRIRR